MQRGGRERRESEGSRVRDKEKEEGEMNVGGRKPKKKRGGTALESSDC